MSEEERIYSLSHYNDLLARADQLKQHILAAATLEEIATLQVQTEALVKELGICVDRVREERQAKTVFRSNEFECGRHSNSTGSLPPPPAVRLMQNQTQPHIRQL